MVPAGHVHCDADMNLAERVCEKAQSLGFDLVGISPAVPVPHIDAYTTWIAKGYHGEMGYMARADRVERRENPAAILPSARSIVCVGLDYYPGPTPNAPDRAPSRGLIASYAWGQDYHDLMQPRLEELADFIHTEARSNTATRAYVDTGPILERAYAAQAGLGFIGKNTCLINPQMGSWLFLGEILTDVELEPTPGKTNSSCGTCRRCLDACPTGALIAPYVLDARRCISYLTIELKGFIPPDLRPLMGNWIYGCDICQQACPWQRFAVTTRERTFLAQALNRTVPLLTELIEMSEKVFRQRYAGTPILRTGRARLLRNAAVALGNLEDEHAVPALQHALTDSEPLVRGHAAWALGRIGGKAKHEILKNALQDEMNSDVREEIQTAI
jgi:epoxyqueuosine reductase